VGVEEPPASVLDWVRGRLGPAAVVRRGLRQGGGPWLIGDGSGRAVAVLKTGVAEEPRAIAGERAALDVAARAGAPAPRTIACDPDGARAGLPALLESVVEGLSRIPRTASPARLRAAGAAVAVLHAVALRPGHVLPHRTRPIPIEDFAAARAAGAASTPLLDRAADRVRRTPAPDAATVFVHGDMWHGNLLWTGDEVTGIVDWDMAGAGAAGVDVGALRLDAALLYGPEAADAVLDGWRSVRGASAGGVAYWDAVAALNTPTDLRPFLPAVHDQGRTDLRAGPVTARRDEFLRAALTRLVAG
jgi:aminoglycoside phosphotransferase (APT) family kinase protein